MWLLLCKRNRQLLSLRVAYIFFLYLLSFSSNANIIVSSNTPVNEIEEALLKDMMASPVVQTALAALDNTVHFPQTLKLVYGETPVASLRPGPHYVNGKISIPYRYVFQLRQYLNKRKHIHHYQNVDDLVFSSLIFAVLHEAGHALIDQHALPILGREEDVVDNFATYVLLNHVDNGADILKAAAVVFDLRSRTGRSITEKDMQGEHRLARQRYYTLLCNLYGSQTSVDVEGLFNSRQKTRCVRDYQQLSRGWQYILNSLTP